MARVIVLVALLLGTAAAKTLIFDSGCKENCKSCTKKTEYSTSALACKQDSVSRKWYKAACTSLGYTLVEFKNSLCTSRTGTTFEGTFLRGCTKDTPSGKYEKAIKCKTDETTTKDNNEKTTTDASTIATTTAAPDDAKLVVMSECDDTCGTCSKEVEYKNNGECIHDTEKSNWYKAKCTDSDYTITEYSEDNCGGDGKERKGKVACSTTSTTYTLRKLVVDNETVVLKKCNEATSENSCDMCDKGDEKLETLNGTCQNVTDADGNLLYTYNGTYEDNKITVAYYGTAGNCDGDAVFSVKDKTDGDCVTISTSTKHEKATCTNNGSSSAQSFFLVTLGAVLVSLLA